MGEPAGTAIVGAQAPERAKERAGTKMGVPNWQAVENLACARAALDASQRVQKQTGDALEAMTASFYGDAIKMAAQTYGFKEVIVRSATPSAASVMWSVSLSAAHRKLNGRLFHRWNHNIKKECVNVFNPILKNLLNSDGKIPSGKTPADMILETKEALWKADQLKKRKRAPLGAIADGNDAAADDGEETAVPPMAADYEGGPFFLTWSVLGPMGEKHPSLRLATKDDEAAAVEQVGGTDGGTTLANTGRAAQRSTALALGTHSNRPHGNLGKRSSAKDGAERQVTQKPDSQGVSSAFAQVQACIPFLLPSLLPSCFCLSLCGLLAAL